jgi:hypothetical protein
MDMHGGISNSFSRKQVRTNLRKSELKSSKGEVMKMKTLPSIIVITVTTMLLSSSLIYPQSSKNVASQLAISPGSLYLVDGRASLEETGERRRLSCGLASPVAMGKFANPNAGGATGALVKVDLSFGYLPFSRVGFASSDRFTASESFIGSWAVRNVSATAAGGESIALTHFRGPITSGTISSMPGSAPVFDLYGVTNLSAATCGVEGDRNAHRDARRYVRISGTCGNGTDQDLTFQVAVRPPVDRGGELSFEQRDLFAYGTFRGNISCGQITDRSRVRTNLDR